MSFPKLPLTDLKRTVGTPLAYKGKINGVVMGALSITSILSTWEAIFWFGMMFPDFTYDTKVS